MSQVRRGAPWALTIGLSDDDGPIPLALPAALDLRLGPSTSDVLALRVDSTGGAITEDGGELTAVAATEALPPGVPLFWDLWAYRDVPGAEVECFASGELVVVDRITDPLPVP